jgi:hypothetical protein
MEALHRRAMEARDMAEIVANADNKAQGKPDALRLENEQF